MPHVIPPSAWERASRGLTIRPAAKTPSSRVTRSSWVAESTETSANCAPYACREYACIASTSSRVPANALSPSAGISPSISSRSLRQARTIACPQEAVPSEAKPPIAQGSEVSPSSTTTSSTPTPSSSAAICASAVRDPVPMSTAAIETT